MSAKPSPYLPYPDDPAVARDLVPIKDAADDFDCSVDTLKKNAKSRRFPAYQLGQGMPVFVMPAEIEKFLKSRRDIDSVFRKRAVAKPAATKQPSSTSDGVGGGPAAAAQSPHSAAQGGVLLLKSLEGAPPEQVALVADCLVELAGILTAKNATNPMGSTTGHDETSDSIPTAEP